MKIDAATLYRQIGLSTLLAAPGRARGFYVDDATIGFKVGQGYVVTVTLDPSDTYTVRRCTLRKGALTTKGEQTMVYCEELSDTFWNASCYVNVTFGEHRR